MKFMGAWDSDIYRLYTWIVVGLVASAIVAIAGLASAGRDVSKAKRSLSGWMWMLPIILGCLFVGRTATIFAIGVLAIGGFWEFARATRLSDNRWLTGTALGCLVLQTLAAWAHDPHNDVDGSYGWFMAMPTFAVCAILVVPILQDRVQGQLSLLATAIIGYIYIGWMFLHLAFLSNAANAYGYLLYLLFAVEINDIAAFVFGRFFGRKKLRPNVSPNKTWAGSIGAIGVSLALPWVLHFSFPHFRALDCIAVGLIVGIGGQLGDLSISVIKRDLGIKDMGTLIPGHGGILDRIDSMIFVAPLFFHWIRYHHSFYG